MSADAALHTDAAVNALLPTLLAPARLMADSASAAAPPADAQPQGDAADAKQRRYQRSDFDLHEPLGEGAFGQVFRATHRDSGREFAVKVLSKQHLMRSNKVEEVRRERDMLNALKHPNLIKLFCTFQDAHNLYIVLEFCSGGELFSHIQRLGSICLPACQFVVAEVVEGLEYMHSQKVIHRDLKPENIIFTEDMHVRITDFGTAIHFGEETGVAVGDKKAGFTGTAEYVSPEMLKDEQVSSAADIWALGCIVFQMLAGRPPFRGGSDYLTFQQILHRDLTFPPHFPPDARDFVESLLAMDPTARPTAAQLKTHPFLADIAWGKLGETQPPRLEPLLVEGAAVASLLDRASQLKEQEQSCWAKFLIPNELIVFSGLVIKRVGLSSKKRQLILTDTPRMIYIDPVKMVQKGEILWHEKLAPELKNERQFFIHTPGRSYNLEDISLNAGKWVEMVAAVAEKHAKQAR